MLKPHTGQRKRPRSAGFIEAMEKRRTPRSKAERKAMVRFYEPSLSNPPLWHCSTCAEAVTEWRCQKCGEHMPAIPDA